MSAEQLLITKKINIGIILKGKKAQFTYIQYKAVPDKVPTISKSETARDKKVYWGTFPIFLFVKKRNQNLFDCHHFLL